jgi:chromosomal replication initiation ATPase DnaA
VTSIARVQLTRPAFETRVRRSTAQRVDGHWEITCVNALAQDWMEHRLATLIRRELAVAAGEEVREIRFRAKPAKSDESVHVL